MKLLVNIDTGAIHDASNVGSWVVPAGYAVLTMAGDVETLAWPLGSPTRCRVVDDQIVAVDGLQDVRVELKLAEINTAFEAAADQLISSYPAAEKLTWPIQEKEALAWQADANAATPYLDALATARGISRIDFLNRTAAKVNTFRAASATLVGTRQKYEDQVVAAIDVAAIEAINPVF